MFRKYKPEPVNATYTAEASMSSEELTEFMESLPETDFLEYQKGFGYGPGHEGWDKDTSDAVEAVRTAERAASPEYTVKMKYDDSQGLGRIEVGAREVEILSATGSTIQILAGDRGPRSPGFQKFKLEGTFEAESFDEFRELLSEGPDWR
jgi:hypothetical protein